MTYISIAGSMWYRAFYTFRCCTALSIAMSIAVGQSNSKLKFLQALIGRLLPLLTIRPCLPSCMVGYQHCKASASAACGDLVIAQCSAPLNAEHPARQAACIHDSLYKVQHATILTCRTKWPVLSNIRMTMPREEPRRHHRTCNLRQTPTHSPL